MYALSAAELCEILGINRTKEGEDVMMFLAKHMIRLLMVLVVLGIFNVSAFAVTETSEAAKPEIDPKEIQTALTEAGLYKGPIDGVIGSKTKEAIRKFQEANDLKVDGVCGPKTWEKLKAYSEEAADIDAATTTTPATEEVATTPTLDEASDEDYGYSEYDSTAGSDTESYELKQKLVS